MPIEDRLKLRGRVEIFNKDTGEKILDADNLVLFISRAAILQVMFNDDNVMINANSVNHNKLPRIDNNDLYPQIPHYRRLICGFCFGDNGCKPNTNPAIVRVPSPNDIAEVSTIIGDGGDFHAIPIINLSGTGDNGVQILNASGSYEDLDEIINDYIVSDDGSSVSIDSDSSSATSTSTYVEYFNLAPYGNASTDTQNAYYCKTFKTEYSETIIDPVTSEIDYRVNLDVMSYDLVGQTFSEIGLVMADCLMSDDGVITEIKPNSGVLATRVAFAPLSLSTQLSSQFSIRYHIYI